MSQHHCCEVCFVRCAMKSRKNQIQHHRPQIQTTAELSSTISDDASCSSSQSSVRRRVEELRIYQENGFRHYQQEKRPTSTTFTKQLIILQKKRIFRFWRDLWIAQSFYRYTKLKCSFVMWQKFQKDRSRSSTDDIYGESEMSDVSDLSSVSTSHTGNLIDYRLPTRNRIKSSKQLKKNFPAMLEINKTIHELTLEYQSNNYDHEDDETLTTLSTLNTVDFIHMASSRPRLDKVPYLSPFLENQHLENNDDNNNGYPNDDDCEEDNESEIENLQFVTTFHSSPDRQRLTRPHSPSWSRHGIGSLLIQHGNILPTQSQLQSQTQQTSLKRSESSSYSLSHSQTTIPLFEGHRSPSRSLSGSPIGHSRKKFNLTKQRTSTTPPPPPPPPPPPLLSLNVKNYSNSRTPDYLFLVEEDVLFHTTLKPTQARCRSLFNRWISLHTRVVGIRLIAEDHFLKRGFGKFLRGLKKRVRFKKKILLSEEFWRKSILHRTLFHRFRSKTSQLSLKSRRSVAVFRQQRSFWKFVTQIDISKTKRTLLQQNYQAAITLFSKRYQSLAFQRWRDFKKRQRVIQSAHKKCVVIARPFLDQWKAFHQRHRKSEWRIPIKEILLRRYLKKWKLQYQRILHQLESCTEMEISRENLMLMKSFRALEGNVSRFTQEQQRIKIADNYHRKRKMSQSFSLLLQHQQRHGRRTSKVKRSGFETPLSRSFRTWIRLCQSRILQRRAEFHGTHFYARRKTRNYFWRLLPRRKKRLSPPPLPPPHLPPPPPPPLTSFSISTKKNAQIQRNRHSDDSYLKLSVSKRSLEESYHLADSWHQRKLLSCCRSFLRKLSRLTLIATASRRRKSQWSLRRNNSLVLKTQKLKSTSLREQRDEYSKEIFLQQKHQQILLFESFLAWMTLARVVQHFRRRRLRVGYRTYLQFCTRHTVTCQLLVLGERYFTLRQKRSYFKTWRRCVPSRDSSAGSNEKGMKRQQAANDYLGRDTSSSQFMHSRPPTHPERFRNQSHVRATHHRQRREDL